MKRRLTVMTSRRSEVEAPMSASCLISSLKRSTTFVTYKGDCVPDL